MDTKLKKLIRRLLNWEQKANIAMMIMLLLNGQLILSKLMIQISMKPMVKLLFLVDLQMIFLQFNQTHWYLDIVMPSI